MRLTGHHAYKFDTFIPFYNWIYPLCGTPSTRFSGEGVTGVFAKIPRPKNRALYFHIPFCQTICTFCPFVRAEFRDPTIVDRYVDALEAEIILKSRYPAVSDVPIKCIFFGGGTPSLLQPSHIRKLGKAIRSCFDLTQLTEFSFEFEVKSVSEEKIEALQEIGVTHARPFPLCSGEQSSQNISQTANLDAIPDQHGLLVGYPELSPFSLANGLRPSRLTSKVDSTVTLPENDL